MALADRASLSVDEVAHAFGVSKSTVYNLARENKLPLKPIRVGKSIRFGRAAVERLLAAEVDEKGPPASEAS